MQAPASAAHFSSPSYTRLCVSQRSVAETIYLTLRKMVWLTVLEVFQVHRQFTYRFGPVVRYTSWWEHEAEQNHSFHGQGERERERRQVPQFPSRACL
jgi:hypothetical protein